MAKRPDFTRKLLDDLQLRKQRMDASQSSESRNQLPAGGSGGIKTHQNARNGNRMNKSNGDGQSSSQIVPARRSQNSEQIGNLSMALTFALENGEKRRRTGSTGIRTILNFLHQIGRRKMNIWRSEGKNNILKRYHYQPSTSSPPVLSPLQIEQISTGAQKLNQILIDLNFAGYSIEIGNKLIQGAIDLEESLRILIDKQEASQYTENGKGKSRIILLDENEEEEVKIIDVARHKRPDRPIFSFDKPGRSRDNMRESTMADHKMRLASLTYSHRAEKLNHETGVIAASSPHTTHSRSHISEPKPTTSSHTQQEKARLPSVIAKLMGLDNLPGNLTQNEKGRSEKREGLVKKKTSPETNKKAAGQQMRVGTNIIHPIMKKTQAKNSTTIECKTTLPTGKVVTAINGRTQVTITSKSLPWKDIGELKPAAVSENVTNNIDGPRLNEMKDTAKREHNEADRFHQETQEERNRDEGMGKQNMKSKLQGRKQKGREPTSNNLPKTKMSAANMQESYSQMMPAPSSWKAPKELAHLRQINRHQNGGQYKTHARESSIGLNPKTKHVTDRISNTESSLLATEKRPSEDRVTLKDKTSKGHRLGMTLKVNEKMSTKEGNFNFPETLKHQEAVPQAGKHKRFEKLSVSVKANEVKTCRKLEAQVIESKKPVATIRSSSITGELQHKALQDSISYLPRGEFQSLNHLRALTLADSHQKFVQDHQEGREIVSDKDEKLKLHNSVLNPLHGIHNERRETLPPSQLGLPQTISKAETPEKLTGSQIHIKQILTRSEEFLNAAEALFKFNIPFDNLNATHHSFQDRDSKLIVDCGYEIMRRKRKMEELSIPPLARLSITSMEVKSLDDLIKQLCKNFEKLKFHEKNGEVEFVFPDYLSKMLEIDVRSKDPEVNCMWELGWNDMMFAFLEKDDVVRNVEKHVLNGILDEIIIDICSGINN